MEKITSRSNTLIAHLRKLGRDRAYRKQCHMFLCDGPKLLEEALLWGGEVETVLKTEETILPAALPPSVRVVTVPADLLLWVSPVQQPQGCLFACRMQETEVPDRLTGKRYAVLEGLQDPGNVGTILRTAAAFSLDGVFLTEGCADLWNPKTVRATMGAVFRMPAWQTGRSEAVELLRAAGLPLYGAALGADCIAVGQTAPALAPGAVAIGSEGKGLSDALLQLCDRRVQIPMDPRCESLNAAVAAGILFWEMRRSEEGKRTPCQH